jgi:hypothetical protein
MKKEIILTDELKAKLCSVKSGEEAAASKRPEARPGG